MSIKELAIKVFNDSATELIKENGSFTIQEMVGNDSIVYLVATSSLLRTNNEKAVTVAKVKEGGILEYISFFDKFTKMFDDAGISYSKTESGNAIRLNEMEFVAASSNPHFSSIIEHIILQSFNYARFGCCSRYLECSDAKKCVHKDIFYASAACQYKSHLDKGEIFYGKNKTI